MSAPTSANRAGAVKIVASVFVVTLAVGVRCSSRR